MGQERSPNRMERALPVLYGSRRGFRIAVLHWKQFPHRGFGPGRPAGTASRTTPDRAEEGGNRQWRQEP